MDLVTSQPGPLSHDLKAVTKELAVKQFTNLQLAWREAHKQRDFRKLKATLDTEDAFRKFVQDQQLGDQLKDEIAADYLRGERALGELWRVMPKNPGTRTVGGSVDGISGSSILEPPENALTLADRGLDKKRAMRDLCFADLEADAFDQIIAQRRTNNDLSVFGVYADVKREFARRKNAQKQYGEAADAEGTFDVLVIDPPWPIEKIQRDVRPNQVGLDYPTMSQSELLEWSYAREKAADDCHVFLWATHRFLPFAFDCLQAWGAQYACTFGWLKPGGIQPLNFPQLNLEFCLYARYGSPCFVDVTNFNAGFSAPRGFHSQKPEFFYETLRRVTAGRRLDMFNRRKIEGFVGWGKEAAI
jgi:N6-adenosine-specific RNA methylase IME4